MIKLTRKRCPHLHCASPQEYSIRQATFGRGPPDCYRAASLPEGVQSCLEQPYE
jgi:hypothetical protein